LRELRNTPYLDRQFAFTYSIESISDDTTEWANRMEHYLNIGNENIHMAAILLSLGILLTLACILSSLMKRGLNKDFVNIVKNRLMRNQRRQERARLPTNDDAEQTSLKKKKATVEAEDVAWKKIHADVFRSPAFPHIFACLMGAGTQIYCVFFTVLFAITVAFAKTEWRPHIYTTTMVILALWGSINGYVTSRSLKFHGTTDWNFSAAIAAFTLPLFVIGSMCFEQFFAWLSRSALRYSFAENMARIIGWYLLNGVMCYAGAYKGYT